MKKGIIITAFVVGVILTIFVYQAVTIFQLRSQVAGDHATLTQVVDFLNQNIQQAQQQNQQQVAKPAQISTAPETVKAPAPAKK